MGDDEQHLDLPALTTDVIASYVAKNAIGAADLPKLIQDVHAALARAAAPVVETPAEPLTPPISIKKSITKDYLISFEDGRPYKTLTRHLGTHGMSPEQYRAKWNLPANYPMVAESYSARRSEIAKELRFGRKRKVAAAPEPLPARKAVRKGRGRKSTT